MKLAFGGTKSKVGASMLCGVIVCIKHQKERKIWRKYEKRLIHRHTHITSNHASM